MPTIPIPEPEQALLDTLEALRIEVRPGASRSGADFVFAIGDQEFVAEVKSVVTAAGAEPFIRKLRSRTEHAVVVADRIADDAKRQFRAAGISYFDRRGDLRLVAPPIIVDTRVDAITRATRRTDPLGSQVAKEVAIACLLAPNDSHGVREIAAFIDRAPSAVSKAMSDLRAVGLLTSRNEPLVPDLFQELAMRWRRETVPLLRVPDRSDEARLDLQLHDLDAPGWALTDTRAANAWGMPIVAAGDYPPDFLVPSGAVFRRAIALLGAADNPNERACAIAIAPVRLACMYRHVRGSEAWPAANHIVVALDIAADRARGIETLEQWNPTDVTRAW